MRNVGARIATARLRDPVTLRGMRRTSVAVLAATTLILSHEAHADYASDQARARQNATEPVQPEQRSIELRRADGAGARACAQYVRGAPDDVSAGGAEPRGFHLPASIELWFAVVDLPTQRRHSSPLGQRTRRGCRHAGAHGPDHCDRTGL